MGVTRLILKQKPPCWANSSRTEWGELLLKNKKRRFAVPLPSSSAGNISTVIAEAFLGILGILGACIPGFLLLYTSSKFRFEEVVVREEPEQTAAPTFPQTTAVTPNLRVPALTGIPEVSALKTSEFKGYLYLIFNLILALS